jgi:hypothetical protein
VLLAVGGAIQPALAQEDVAASAMCHRAGLEAERKLNLPAGLLLAIGLVESGRHDSLTGRVAAWPWTINGAGVGRLFETSAEALAATRALQARGVSSIDVGCFQINLHHHPTAFSSLEEAFDPQANAAYAARFLLTLRSRMGSWEKAVAAYHSAVAERGGPYRDRVMAGWSRDAAVPVVVAPLFERVMVWMPVPVTGRVQIWTPSAPDLAPTTISIRSVSGRPQAALPTVKTPVPAR